MKLTKGEFCQFSLSTRFELIKEFGRNILKKKIGKKSIAIYKIFDFYVEVLEGSSGQCPEKIEPVKNVHILKFYNSF